jgi:DNA polymerase III subunit delta
MAKKEIPSISDLPKFISKEKFLPLYFFCGEDQYSIDLAVETVEKAIMPSLHSDFDRELFNGEKGQNLAQILDVAFSFPFGGGKKLIIIKNFEKFSDKKELTGYIGHPPEFTVLIITQPGKVADFSREPYSSLLSKQSLFEARNSSGEELVRWVTTNSRQSGVSFSDDNARTLIEIVGEDKMLLDMQIRKFINFTSDGNELSFDDIKKLSSPTKEYSIFDLQDAVGKGDRVKALEVGYNLLDSGTDIVQIVNMIAKYVLVLAQMTELLKLNISDFEAAKLAGVSYGYFMNSKRGTYMMQDTRLLNASRALLEADLSVKSSDVNPKTVILTLITRLNGEPVPAI